jgi:CheY-like chemotaxis protein
MPNHQAVHGHRALIVDPDPDTRALHALTLADLFDTIEEAVDGADALAQALHSPPTLLVTELRLPRVDGRSLCSMMRADAAAKNLRIMVVTGTADDRTASQVRAAGADVVLAKPVSPERVHDEAARLLSARDGLAAAIADSAEQTVRARRLVAASSRQRIMSRAYVRERTTAPPSAPPELRCPTCDEALTYHYSNVGGVSPKFPEQWDYYECARCGPYQYRHRTRRLRRAS